MITYFFRKLLYGLLVLFGVVTVIFLLFHVLPGDPARLMLGQRSDSASVNSINRELGLNKSKWLQYLKYVDDLSFISIYNKSDINSYFYFDKARYTRSASLFNSSKAIVVLKFPYLRRSYQSGKSVSAIIAETLPNTFILALTSILFASLIGILWGIIAAIRHDSLFDKLSLVIASLGMSIPSFFAAILFAWFFAFILAGFTGLNMTGNLFEMDEAGNASHLVLKNLILPAFTLGIRPLSIVLQLSRNAMLDVLSQDYIRTAKAKGLLFRNIIFHHALKNSLNPVITAISGWFASLMAGVVFIEYIFGWKGLGYVIVEALSRYDFPIVMGAVLTISLIFIIINLMVDIVYALLDPAVRLE
ncbi:MAG: ABC transporter permease [Bacteroidia bacterium]|nr:ABC transporter permease [Bacteroidia bacterium]